jgi:transcriptional regulator with XRE-family HTH domain
MYARGVVTSNFAPGALEFNRLVGAEIKIAIEKSGKTITSVAEAIAVERATLSRYCSGVKPIPVPTLLSICEEIGVSASELVARAEALIQTQQQ